MSQHYSCRRRVEFRDTDAAGIMHFSAYITYMEEAEHEFLRALGTSVVVHDGSSLVSWPRVAVHCDYRGSVRFEQEFTVEVEVRRLGRTSATYGFRFVRESTEFAHGEMTVVCCRFDPGAPPRPLPIPDELRAHLAPYIVHSDNGRNRS